MSAIHEYKCDCCKKRRPAVWNREHYLIPKNWGEVRSVDLGLIGHLCDKCLVEKKLTQKGKTSKIGGGGKK